MGVISGNNTINPNNNVTIQNDFNHFSMNDDFDNIRLPTKANVDTNAFNIPNQNTIEPNITMEDEYMYN